LKMVLAMEVKTSPTLSSGAFTVDFGDYEKVKNAIAMTQEPLGAAGDGKLFCFKTECSGNDVTVTILKVDLEQATDADRDWEVATTSDLSDKTVVVIADCE